jgi:hypothetical protein
MKQLGGDDRPKPLLASMSKLAHLNHDGSEGNKTKDGNHKDLDICSSSFIVARMQELCFLRRLCLIISSEMAPKHKSIYRNAFDETLQTIQD